MRRPPPRSTLFPYTTLFRSGCRSVGSWMCHRCWSEVRRLEDPLCRRCGRSEEHTSELQSRQYLVCRLLLEKKNSEFEPHEQVASPEGKPAQRQFGCTRHRRG